MRFLHLPWLLLSSTLAVAGVYKWIGPDGRVQYSDRPTDGSERVTITAEKGTDNYETAPTAAVTDAELGPYTAFELVNPEPNSTLRNAEGNVRVALVLDPPLMAGHRLQIEVDSQKVPGDTAGTQIQLQGLGYGSHRLQAFVFDEFEVPIATSAVVDFHLRKPLPGPPIP